jgi:FixJ family two-component response regulator
MPTRTVRVAVVDDDLSVRKALKRLLSARSLQTETFASAQEFLASLPHGLPDCLVLDLHMPGMTGLELQSHLASRGLSIPTVAITAHDDPRLARFSRSSGAAAVLLKPLDGSALIEAIDAAIRDAKSSDADSGTA